LDNNLHLLDKTNDDLTELLQLHLIGCIGFHINQPQDGLPKHIHLGVPRVLLAAFMVVIVEIFDGVVAETIRAEQFKLANEFAFE
jgi:hypothetical protein